MLFNSFEFLLFLPTVFALYWILFYKYRDVRNIFLIAVSYLFYGWWDWRFLGLIVFSTLVDYVVGIAMGRTDVRRKRKALLLVSMFTNLGLLGFFKYFNFFAENFAVAMSSIGWQVDPLTLQIVLPVGISFYTFQTMSYTIDVYRKDLEPTLNLWAFGAYVSFFPQLVAGPIERATHLLPQFFKTHKFTYDQAADGMRLMLWGFFKKLVIADNCAVVVNEVFGHYTEMSVLQLLLGVFCFAFQIYGDFSGYSDLAIGAAKLFGFDLMTNFRTPYFSRDIAEFWRRWHISLSTWFRDYLYIPMGGSRGTTVKVLINTIVVFLISGFWHGANWTFLVWGGLNALFFLPLLLSKNNRRHLDTVAQKSRFPSRRELGAMGITFTLTCIAWVFFRSPSIADAMAFFQELVFHPNGMIGKNILPHALFIGFPMLLIIDWVIRKESFIITRQWKWRHPFYFMVALMVLLLGRFSNQEFIYFQF